MARVLTFTIDDLGDEFDVKLDMAKGLSEHEERLTAFQGMVHERSGVILAEMLGREERGTSDR